MKEAEQLVRADRDRPDVRVLPRRTIREVLPALERLRASLPYQSLSSVETLRELRREDI
jgi:hypothetical protein